MIETRTELGQLLLQVHVRTVAYMYVLTETTKSTEKLPWYNCATDRTKGSYRYAQKQLLAAANPACGHRHPQPRSSGS